MRNTLHPQRRMIPIVSLASKQLIYNSAFLARRVGDNLPESSFALATVDPVSRAAHAVRQHPLGEAHMTLPQHCIYVIKSLRTGFTKGQA